MKKTLTLLIAILLMVGVAGCGSSGSDEAGTSPEDLYVGTWKTGNGFYSIHGADGTWKVGFTLNSAESSPIIWGTYTFDGTTMTSVTDEASQSCAGVTAVYEIGVSEDGDVVTTTPIDDPCDSVRGTDTSQITRYIP